ncbi:hypothetical protein CBR_g3955 [Chara braunii]|uniref:UspA domain-containing protein n=1 Tax=Chara braunii TaxID=69332 RepID=A0A388KGY4_CHABU|nr:hypothetical protein CBR_g3955 [Chara braunii]|eukprot:GBG69257.1 hypothetical protein CBR_g3955 [Chara braunii]
MERGEADVNSRGGGEGERGGVSSPTGTTAAPSREETAVNDRKPMNVVVAVDQGEESMYALLWALDFVVEPKDRVHLLHVQAPSPFFATPQQVPGYYISAEVSEALRRQEEEISRGVLSKAKTMCEKKNVQPIKEVTMGDARECIVDAVAQLKANLLVIGSHGYGALKRAFLGSVSDYCVHHCKCPVLVVRLPKDRVVVDNSEG